MQISAVMVWNVTGTMQMDVMIIRVSVIRVSVMRMKMYGWNQIAL